MKEFLETCKHTIKNKIILIKNRIINKLGGFTKEDHYQAIKWWNNKCEDLRKNYQIIKTERDEWKDHATKYSESFQDIFKRHNELASSIHSVDSVIDINPIFGYTIDNVIPQSRPQMYYQIGEAVYPYVKHTVLDDKYICTINIQETHNDKPNNMSEPYENVGE